jgi:hypothetical protein
MQPHIISKSELIEFLADSFKSWPNTLSEAERTKIPADYGKSGVAAQDFSSLLDATQFHLQLDYALENAIANYKSRIVNYEAGVQWLNNRLHLSYRNNRPLPLIEIFVSVHIHAISVPDPAKDEVTLDVRVYSGCNFTKLLNYAQQKCIFTEEEISDLQRRWDDHNLSIGILEPEMHKLDQILEVCFLGISAEHRRQAAYTKGIESGCLWRYCDTTYTYPVKLRLADFPTDKNSILIFIKGAAGSALSKRMLPDPTVAARSLYFDPPRGFEVVNKSEHLEPIFHSESEDTFIESRLIFYFELHRNPSTIRWRVLAPTIIILLLCSAATILAGFGIIKDANSVLTSVIPSVLIACVAMQITAGQMAPPQSGRTRLDIHFFIFYLVILLEFVALIMIAHFKKEPIDHSNAPQHAPCSAPSTVQAWRADS